MKSRLKNAGLFLVLTFVFGTFLLFALGKGIMVSEDKAIRALEDQGFSHVEVTDKSYFFIGYRGGSDDDCVRFTARATNPAGK